MRLLSREKLRAYRLKVSVCERLESAKQYRDEALADGQQVATEVLYAEARLGELLAETVRTGGDRKSNSSRDELGHVIKNLPEGRRPLSSRGDNAFALSIAPRPCCLCQQFPQNHHVMI
jgi:hypothetical protein